MEEKFSKVVKKLDITCPNCSHPIELQLSAEKVYFEEAQNLRAVPFARFSELNIKKNFYINKLAEIKAIDKTELIQNLREEYKAYKKKIEDEKLARREQRKIPEIESEDVN